MNSSEILFLAHTARVAVCCLGTLDVCLASTYFFLVYLISLNMVNLLVGGGVSE